MKDLTEEQVEKAAAEERLRSHKYTDWGSAGGPNECQHGFAAGIPCRLCDQLLVGLGEQLCEDEGCGHAGTPYVCVDKPSAAVTEERILELIEASEKFPLYEKWLEPTAAFHDVAALLQELLERRKG